MKSKVVLVMFILGNIIAFGQESWGEDFMAAQTKAKIEGKDVMLIFSGSDWCLPCIKLKKEILTTDAFENFAKDKLVLINADFPKKKKNKAKQSLIVQGQNVNLAKKYNPEGYYPRVLIFDQQGKIKADMGYEPVSPEEYVKLIKSKL